MAEGLEQLRDTLLVQCRPTEAATALDLAQNSGSGVVVTGARDRRTVLTLAHLAHRRRVPMLFDSDRYSGASRRRATARFDPAWLDLQREADLPVLTDSGYVAPDDVEGLEAVLGQARALGDVIATLPLNAGWWFDPRHGLPHLLDRVHAAGVPVALVLEHPGDPYSVARTLSGVLELLRVGVPVLQLRCDVSGLGLLCHGAHAAAIGTGSSLRHLYPQTKGGPPPGPRVPSTVVRDCLSFHTIDRIARAVAADPDSLLWTGCPCPTCNGRTLDHIATAPDHEQAPRAFGHALHMLFALRDGLVGQPVHRAIDAIARQESWREQCSSAAFRFDEIHEAGQTWRVPAFLRNWRAVPVPSHTA
jgi:hypothetical protein